MTKGCKRTSDPVAKGEPGVSGAESVTQQLLLEVDDRLQHNPVLDLGGGDHNAAVHEVCDGIGYFLFSLGQVGLQTEHLREHQHTLHTLQRNLGDGTWSGSSLSPSRPSEHPSHGRFRCSLYRPGWGPPSQRCNGRGWGSPGRTPSPQSQPAVQNPPRVSGGTPAHLTDASTFTTQFRANTKSRRRPRTHR